MAARPRRADHDWVRIELTGGQSGVGFTALADPYLRVRDSAGNEIASNDDSGPGRDSMLRLNVGTSGTYYIDVGAYTRQSNRTPKRGGAPGRSFLMKM